jgi:SAM-dependent methyltransferase
MRLRDKDILRLKMMKRYFRAIYSRLFPSKTELYIRADRKLRKFDRERLYRANELSFVPGPSGRGRTPYGEWCHQLGIFQTLMHQHSDRNTPAVVVDIGCGLGKFVPAVLTLPKPVLYIGLDIREGAIDKARNTYNLPNVEFHLVDVNNPFYNANNDKSSPYPVESESATLITALSVWTHLSPSDALYYFKEIERMLKPGGKAIITCFLLGDEYNKRINTLKNTIHDFSVPFEDSTNWYSSVNVEIMEHMVGITPSGVAEKLLENTSLKWLDTLSGFWNGSTGAFYQDILVFEKPLSNNQQ